METTQSIYNFERKIAPTSKSHEIGVSNYFLRFARLFWSNSEKLWKDTARTKAGAESFSIDSAKLWNTIPDDIKNAPTIGIAKHAIKKFCKTLEL